MAIAGVLAAAPALAQEMRPSLADSFRLGSPGGLLCRAQSRLTDPAFASMFDRGYIIACRDAASEVGRVYALRLGGDDPAARLDAARAERARCEPAAGETIDELGAVEARRCTLASADVGYRVYSWRRGDTLYVAEGLGGYDPALRLALRSIVADRILPGELAIATTEMGDPGAFARVQAGTLDRDQALSEGYRRNNSGSYAEASEFFESLIARNAGADDPEAEARAGEYLINQALQQSNLGNFAEADALYARARAIPSTNAVQLRLRRNFLALHALNQRRLDEAMAVLDAPVAGLSAMGGARAGGAEIDPPTARAINSADGVARRFGGEESDRLTDAERATILDAQALQLRGTILHLRGDVGPARAALDEALAMIVTVRGGRVRSTARLVAQTLAERARIDEEAGDHGAAEERLRAAAALVDMQYPFSPAASAQRAQLAGFLARRGRTAEAMAMFDRIVRENADGEAGLDNLLLPYFELLIAGLPANPALAADLFRASETLIRPGVADTQAVLARELSAGNDEAARLFRQSLNLTRAIEATRIELAQLRAIEGPDALVVEQIALRDAELAALIAEQTGIQARLSAIPRYQAVSTQALELADLQATLRPGEAYLKLIEVGDTVFAIFATQGEATAWRLPIDGIALAERVAALRATISTVENNVRLTYPFDVALSHRLFTEMLAPVAARLGEVDHLIFEPDGAMLSLPPNLLVSDAASAADYEGRASIVGADPFDFTGVAWLGRETDVSTAVSARAFRDVRALAPSSAARQYLGLGENAPRGGELTLASARGPESASGVDCSWPVSAWSAPISARELTTAQALIGGGGSELVTGAAFTDTAIMARDDLSDFRILHFATHGIVTPPRPQCPSRPALLTTHAGGESDGFLSFREIFDLTLDADLVILSACDTASAAGLAASREAGVAGGDAALDGLVRAFVGAGSRAVIASHWPAPDDFGATERLITQFFAGAPGTGIAVSLRAAQTALMDDPTTSHPYYWAGFAVIGDGARPVLPGR